MMKWFDVDKHSPVEGTEHVLVYSPHNENIEFRIMPLFMFDKANMNWTHWAYLEKPEVTNDECNLRTLY